MIISDGEREFAEISDAMERLVHERKSDTVGAISGNVTRVADARISGSLEYFQSVESSISPAEGRSGFTLLASNSGIRGVGLYFRSGKVGYVVVVGDAEPCRKEYAETLAEFIAIGGDKYGLKLEGGTWND